MFARAVIVLHQLQPVRSLYFMNEVEPYMLLAWAYHPVDLFGRSYLLEASIDILNLQVLAYGQENVWSLWAEVTGRLQLSRRSCTAAPISTYLEVIPFTGASASMQRALLNASALSFREINVLQFYMLQIGCLSEHLLCRGGMYSAHDNCGHDQSRDHSHPQGFIPHSRLSCEVRQSDSSARICNDWLQILRVGLGKYYWVSWSPLSVCLLAEAIRSQLVIKAMSS